MNWWFLLAIVLAVIIISIYLLITKLSLKEIRNISFTEYYEGGG